MNKKQVDIETRSNGEYWAIFNCVGCGRTMNHQLMQRLDYKISCWYDDCQDINDVVLPQEVKHG